MNTELSDFTAEVADKQAERFSLAIKALGFSAEVNEAMTGLVRALVREGALEMVSRVFVVVAGKAK